MQLSMFLSATSVALSSNSLQVVCSNQQPTNHTTAQMSCQLFFGNFSKFFDTFSKNFSTPILP